MPRPRSLSRPRREVDIADFVNLKQQQLSLNRLMTWLQLAGTVCDLPALALLPSLLSEVLEGFGVFLYRTGA
eukprot:7408464-Heterocapsa_arctica.AAC.1